MSLSENDREKLLLITRQLAVAFVEDMDHMRKVVGAPPDPGELRRLSGTLRRLLVDREILSVAAPRIGRFVIDAPDEKPMIDYVKATPIIVFFATLGAPIRFDDGHHHILRDLTAATRARFPIVPPPQIDKDKRIPLRLDNFLAQPVFFIHGGWINRRQVIKYVANVGSGVHSGSAADESEARIEAVRCSLRLPIGGNIPISKDGSPQRPIVEINVDAFSPGDLTFDFKGGYLDPLLAELLSIAYYLTESGPSMELEQKIREELNWNGDPPA